jgi:hypothetical protein
VGSAATGAAMRRSPIRTQAMNIIYFLAIIFPPIFMVLSHIDP